jgi:hypothetical protein
VVTVHPELGARGGDIVAGEFGGTAACMFLNATLPPLWANMAKVGLGVVFAYLGAQRASRLGVMMWVGGLRMISSVLEFASYPRELKKLAYDIKTGRLAYLRLHEWTTWSDEPVVFSETPPSEYAPQSVVATAVEPKVVVVRSEAPPSSEGQHTQHTATGGCSGPKPAVEAAAEVSAGKTNIDLLRVFEI